MDLLDTQIFPLVGEEGFARLVAGFYQRVPTDDLLGPLYPPHDLPGAEQRLRDFLVMRFGGPDRYAQTPRPPARWACGTGGSGSTGRRGTGGCR